MGVGIGIASLIRAMFAKAALASVLRNERSDLYCSLSSLQHIISHPAPGVPMAALPLLKSQSLIASTSVRACIEIRFSRFGRSAKVDKLVEAVKKYIVAYSSTSRDYRSDRLLPSPESWPLIQLIPRMGARSFRIRI